MSTSSPGVASTLLLGGQDPRNTEGYPVRGLNDPYFPHTRPFGPWARGVITAGMGIMLVAGVAFTIKMISELGLAAVAVLSITAGTVVAGVRAASWERDWRAVSGALLFGGTILLIVAMGIINAGHRVW